MGNTKTCSWTVALVLAAAVAARAVPLEVTSLDDSGPGTLRDAVTQANLDGVPTVITFAPGLAGGTLTPLSSLPALTEGATTIDGDLGGDCVPDVEIDGSLLGAGDGISLESDDNTVRGLVVNNFPDDGVGIPYGADGNVVLCNYVGTEPDGVSAAGNGAAGVAVSGSDNRIGPGNVIAWNGFHGVSVEEYPVPGAYPDFSGWTPDYIGVFTQLEFSDECWSFHSVDNIYPNDGSRNFFDNFGALFTGTVEVSTGGDYSFELSDLDGRGRVMVNAGVVVDSDVQGCCNPSGTVYLAAGSHAIEIAFEAGWGTAGFQLVTSGPGTASFNTVGDFFQLRQPAERNRITQNSIFGHGTIDPNAYGIGLNYSCGQIDGGDVDVGPNTVLNEPSLYFSLHNGGDSFTVDGEAVADGTVELFAAGFGDYKEGREYLGSTSVDPAGAFSITADVPVEYASVTATVTDTAGNTSEFSVPTGIKSFDEVNVGTVMTAYRGETVEVPIYVRDFAATPLGGDQPAGNRIQGFDFQIQFDPGSIQAVSAYRSGVTAGLVPLTENVTTTPDTIRYEVSFDETTDLVPLAVDSPDPGDEVARLVLTIDPQAPLASAQLTLLFATALANQAGTLIETSEITPQPSFFIGLGHGSVNVFTRSATELDATAESSSDVRLRWADPFLGDETGFRVERSDDGGGSYSTIATVGPDDSEYLDTGRSPATLYYYRVVATNGGGDAPPSNPAWVGTFPATAARVCVQQVSGDHSWMRFPSPAYNGTHWANVFYERNGATDDEVYFQFHDSWGNPAGGWVALSDNDMPSRFPTLRWNGNHFGVIWSEHMRGGGGEAASTHFFALLDGNGHVVRKGVRLLDQAPLGKINNDLELAFDWDGGGWGHVAPDVFAPPSSNLAFWRFTEDGDLLTGPVRLSFTTGDEGDVSLVWNGSLYGVAWLHHEGATHEVLFRRFLPDGSSPDPGPVTVWQAPPGEDAIYTSLVWNGAGWAVAWDLVDAAGHQPVYLRLLAADGTPLGSIQRMSDDEDPAWPGSGIGPYDEAPELVHLPGGGYVAYTSSYSYPNGAYEIARLEADAVGDRVGARAFLSDDDGRHSIFAKVATDGTSHQVVYNENRQGSQETGGLLVAADGSILSGPNDHSCCHSPGNPFFQAGSDPAAVTPVEGGFVAVWTDEGSGVRQIYGQYFDGAGNASSSSRQRRAPPRSSWPLSGRQVNGRVGLEGFGDTFATAWKDGNDTVVFDRAHVFGGSFLGEPEIAWSTGGRGDVDLAFSGELYGVAYFNGDDVELQRVDLNGAPVGGPVTVAADNGGQNVQVQWTGAGWAVAWRASSGRIYYTSVDASGRPNGAGPLTVTGNPTWGSHFHLLWTGEHLGLTWLEDRGVDPAGPEVYWSLLAAYGGQLVGDVMVANPALGPGASWLYWTGDRFRLVRGGGDGTTSVDGVHEDEILPDGTVIPDVGQLTNRGTPGAVAYDGTTVGLLWSQLHETYFQTGECLADATPPDCPALAVTMGESAVELDWSGVGDGESTIWRYNLYRDGFLLAELFPWTEHHSDFGYRQDDVHTYEVRAVNGGQGDRLGVVRPGRGERGQDAALPRRAGGERSPRRPLEVRTVERSARPDDGRSGPRRPGGPPAARARRRPRRRHDRARPRRRLRPRQRRRDGRRVTGEGNPRPRRRCRFDRRRSFDFPRRF